MNAPKGWNPADPENDDVRFEGNLLEAVLLVQELRTLLGQAVRAEGVLPYPEWRNAIACKTAVCGSWLNAVKARAFGGVE